MAGANKGQVAVSYGIVLATLVVLSIQPRDKERVLTIHHLLVFSQIHVLLLAAKYASCMHTTRVQYSGTNTLVAMHSQYAQYALWYIYIYIYNSMLLLYAYYQLLGTPIISSQLYYFYVVLRIVCILQQQSVCILQQYAQNSYSSSMLHTVCILHQYPPEYSIHSMHSIRGVRARMHTSLARV